MLMTIVVVAVVGIAVTRAASSLSWRETRRRREFVAGFKDDVELEAVHNLRTDAIVVRTRHRRLVTTLTPETGVLRNMWDVVVVTVRLGTRTTLDLYPEGMIGVLGNDVGFKDIQIGRAFLDRRLTIRGSDADVVRGVMRVASVQRAVTALFENATVDTCFLDAGGQLRVRMKCNVLDVDEARAMINLVHRVAQQLDSAADVAAIVAPASSPLKRDDDNDNDDDHDNDDDGAVGGVSGAPIGIKIF